MALVGARPAGAVSRVSTFVHLSRPILAGANKAVPFESLIRAKGAVLVPRAGDKFLAKSLLFRPIVPQQTAG
jgi:hypothetical protein